MSIQNRNSGDGTRVQVWKDRSKTSYVCGQMIGSNDGIYGILLDSGEYIDVPEHQLK